MSTERIAYYQAAVNENQDNWTGDYFRQMLANEIAKSNERI